MCGIAGIISSEKNFVSTERLKQMTNAIAHRGPDGEGIWINQSNEIGFGHRRLSIIDLSEAGSQPMNYIDRYAIIHNGEIYNYLELKEDLIKRGYSFRSKTDTEVIAAAYDCWKDECVDRFDGMFAFAIWDEKEKELFAARDRFGEKPFFYFFDNKQFVFASEVKAIWSAGIEKKPNLKMLFNFITIGYVDNPNQPEETFFENISKLPAASCLKYKLANNELSFEKYWDIDLDNKIKISDEKAIEQFNHLFSNSVKRRMRSDVAIGTSLSGGLDSSSVVAISNKLKNENDSHKCFTASFQNFERDESVYSKQVADRFSLQQFITSVSVSDLINDWEKFSDQQEEPTSSASAFAQYKVYELANKQGIKVLLDGQGADETLAGYYKYYKWYWQELFHKLKLNRSGEIRAARRNGINERFGIKNIIASLFPDFASVILERQYLLNALRQEDLTHDFVKLQSREAYYSTPPYFNLNGVLYFNTCMHGLEELLRYADRNSMAFGREVRLPFLNHELIEFIFSLPSNFKIRKGWTKWMLRESMKSALPENIVWRKDKVGFEPPQLQWMQDERLQQMISNAKKKLIDERILKPEVLNKTITPKSAYDSENYDWRYLSAASLFK